MRNYLRLFVPVLALVIAGAGCGRPAAPPSRSAAPPSAAPSPTTAPTSPAAFTYCTLLTEADIEAAIPGVDVARLESQADGSCFVYAPLAAFGTTEDRILLTVGSGPTDIAAARVSAEAAQQATATALGATYTAGTVLELAVGDGGIYQGAACCAPVPQLVWKKGNQGFTLILSLYAGGAAALDTEPEQRAVLIELANVINGRVD